MLSSRWRALGRDVAGAATRESALTRIGLSDAVLDGAGPALRTLAGELEERLGRPADAGDLLVLLASVPGGLAARTLGALGLDAKALARSAEDARGGDARSSLLPPAALLAECDAVRAERVTALSAQQGERAAELRRRELELLAEAHEPVERQQEELLMEVRASLGL